MAIQGTGKTTLRAYAGPGEFAFDNTYTKVEITVVTVTVSAIEGGESLTALSYVVFNQLDIGSASIIKQGNDETTDVNGDLVIDISGLGVSAGADVTIIITNYTTTATTANRAAVCFATAA